MALSSEETDNTTVCSSYMVSNLKIQQLDKRQPLLSAGARTEVSRRNASYAVRVWSEGIKSNAHVNYSIHSTSVTRIFEAKYHSIYLRVNNISTPMRRLDRYSLPPWIYKLKSLYEVCIVFAGMGSVWAFKFDWVLSLAISQPHHVQCEIQYVLRNYSNFDSNIIVFVRVWIGSRRRWFVLLSFVQTWRFQFVRNGFSRAKKRLRRRGCFHSPLSAASSRQCDLSFNTELSVGNYRKLPTEPRFYYFQIYSFSTPFWFPLSTVRT